MNVDSRPCKTLDAIMNVVFALVIVCLTSWLVLFTVAIVGHALGMW